MISASRVISFIGLLALAASLPLSEREENTAWAPTINYPNKWTVWCVGASHHVYWDASNPPPQITNPHGSIYLVTNNMVDFDHPLAQGFLLTAGVATITVPSVPPGWYQVDLDGDSGDWSAPFQITNC
ncbi:hypothetical protein L210DRAFT_3431465 [Boletus edulis BED1]|uniref:Uncharacterized protein n=1 Tax=Boletus edulis BED1 TaxID=1328754 RepID=A0AAD4BB97_BOLED|nr:hypothetical protein L210DRAFT_3431465 [Boletus edulis BED1]